MNSTRILEPVITGLLILGIAGGFASHFALRDEVTANGVKLANIETTVQQILRKPVLVLKPRPLSTPGVTMINPRELKELVVQPTLNEMAELWGPGINREAAVNQIVGTYLQESVVNGVTHLKQLGNGPARGLFQIEPATEADIWDNYLSFRPEKASFVRGLMAQHMTDFGPDLAGNLSYQAAMCRIKYWRRRFEWPEDPNDVEALGAIWDKHYNANPNHGFVSDYVQAYRAAGEF